MTAKLYEISKRVFLNPKSGMTAAGIEAEVDKDYGAEATLTISDCFKQAQLTFSVNNKDDIKDTKAKIERLKAMVGKLDEWMEAVEAAGYLTQKQRDRKRRDQEALKKEKI